MKKDSSQRSLFEKDIHVNNEGSNSYFEKIQKYDEVSWSHLKNFGFGDNSKDLSETYFENKGFALEKIEKYFAKSEKEVKKRLRDKRSLDSEFEMPEKRREIRIDFVRDLNGPVKYWASKKGNFFVGFDFEDIGYRGDSEWFKREYVFPDGEFYSLEIPSEKGDNQFQIMSENFDSNFGEGYNLVFFGKGAHVSKKD